MNVHVVFASRHGATGEIAEAIAATLRDAGIAAQAYDLSDAPDPVGCDAVVLGSGVYMGRWLPPARRYARAHASSPANQASVAVQLRTRRRQRAGQRRCHMPRWQWPQVGSCRRSTRSTRT